MKLGSSFIDAKGEKCQDPFWTITDINDKNKTSISRGSNRFRIFKNGIHFNFVKGIPGGNETALPVTSSTAQHDTQEQIDRNPSVTASVTGGSTS